MGKGSGSGDDGRGRRGCRPRSRLRRMGTRGIAGEGQGARIAGADRGSRIEDRGSRIEEIDDRGSDSMRCVEAGRVTGGRRGAPAAKAAAGKAISPVSARSARRTGLHLRNRATGNLLRPRSTCRRRPTSRCPSREFIRRRSAADGCPVGFRRSTADPPIRRSPDCRIPDPSSLPSLLPAPSHLCRRRSARTLAQTHLPHPAPNTLVIVTGNPLSGPGGLIPPNICATFKPQMHPAPFPFGNARGSAPRA